MPSDTSRPRTIVGLILRLAALRRSSLRYALVAMVPVLVAVGALGRCERSVRVATFNIENYPRDERQVHGAFEAIRELDAPVVAVQEITDPAAFADAARAHLGERWTFVHSAGGPLQRVGVLFDAERFELAHQLTHDATRLRGWEGLMQPLSPSGRARRGPPPDSEPFGAPHLRVRPFAPRRGLSTAPEWKGPSRNGRSPWSRTIPRRTTSARSARSHGGAARRLVSDGARESSTAFDSSGYGKPTLEVRLRRRDGGRALRLFVVHLKAGGDFAHVRREQLRRLAPIVLAAVETYDDVVLLGDFNATGEEDRRTLAELARATRLVWASEALACTSYWNRRDGCRGVALDHVLTVRRPDDVSARGPCESVGCDPGDRCPTFHREVSDHCPVTADL